jgi:hypothetical protein
MAVGVTDQRTTYFDKRLIFISLEQLSHRSIVNVHFCRCQNGEVGIKSRARHNVSSVAWHTLRILLAPKIKRLQT